ncbi:MAG: hypothetical protein Q9174_005664 [Haloplaca sp. 1 TL-2023]
MEAAGLALAVVEVSELCLRYGGRLRDKYRSFRDAETGFAERLLILENRWLKIELQVKFLRRVWKDLPDSLQLNMNDILSIINAKLKSAYDTAERTLKKEAVQVELAHPFYKVKTLRRGAYAFSLKDSIDATVRDLDQWQRDLLDPTWYHLILVPGLQVEKAVEEVRKDSDDSDHTLDNLRSLLDKKDHIDDEVTEVFLPTDTVEWRDYGVDYSKAGLGIHRVSKEIVLLDRIQIPEGTNKEQSVSDILHLMHYFSSVDNDLFGFLPCLGAVKDQEHCDLVFSFPPNCDDPTSLRSLLVEHNSTYPLNARLNIARMLARSIMFLHDCKFVHKSLRPDNIICFATQGSYPDKPYMVGLDRFRQIDQRSERLSDDLWYKDIYRHPTRQGIRPEKDYIMQHDIYSLGVCMLEIGLWQSFVTCNDSPESREPNEDYLSTADLAIKDTRRRARRIKRSLEELARKRLPGSMGQIYTSTVISCLTCLDPNNADFGDEAEFEDESGILVGVRFVEKIAQIPYGDKREGNQDIKQQYAGRALGRRSRRVTPATFYTINVAG